jgi:hypothetical protein
MNYIILVQNDDSPHKLQHKALDFCQRKELALVDHLVDQIGQVYAAVLKD